MAENRDYPIDLKWNDGPTERPGDMRCVRCDRPLQLATISRLLGEDGSYRVLLEYVPVMACIAKHMRAINRDFVGRAVNAISNGELSGAYAAIQRGLWRRRTYCARCGLEIDTPAPRERKFRTSITLSANTAMQVTVNAPWIVCSTCGTEQLPNVNDMPQRILKGVTRAFKAAKIDAT